MIATDARGDEVHIGDDIAVAFGNGSRGADLRVGRVVGFSQRRRYADSNTEWVELIEVEWETGFNAGKLTRIEAEHTNKIVRINSRVESPAEPVRFERDDWVHVAGATEGYEMGQVVTHQGDRVSVVMVHSTIPGRSYQNWFTQEKVSLVTEGTA
jgi:hypothetical protein